MVCCFTGHRDIPPEHITLLPEILDYEIERLIVCGVTEFRGGGALGFDTLAELKVLEKKKKYGFITLKLILPCRDQASTWSERNRSIYNYIFSEADSVEYAADRYNATCMHKRNRMLAEGSDFCLAYLTSSAGGTAYTCNYAKKIGVSVINTADKITIY